MPDAVSTPAASTDEDRRLQLLHALDLLDTGHDREFDALAALASTIIGCPTGLVTLIDHDRQWVKARSGSDMEQTPRDTAFCDHTIRGNSVMLIRDALNDPRFADNPLVTGDPHIRFYAGAPIHAVDADGISRAIGAVCMIDTVPRDLSAAQGQALMHLAALAETVIASRKTARDAVEIARSANDQSRILRRQDRLFRRVEHMTMTGSWRLDLNDDAITWSDGVYRIHELDPAANPDLRTALDHYPPRARAQVSAALARTIEHGIPFELELDFITAKGRQRRVRSSGELEIDNARPVAVIGVFQDITDSYRVERALRESASTDEVTRIANRAEFNRVLEAELQAARAGASFVLILIDLDHFKSTNDTYGHLAGDDVLRAVGQRLRAPFLKGSFAARLGGDEFALLLTDPELVADADAVIKRLLEHLKTPVQSHDALLGVSGTIGSARPGPGAETVRELMHAADIALYTAKRARRGSAHAFTEPRAARA